MKPELNELRLLHSGKLATLRALILALLETHPDKAAVAQAFAQKTEELKLFMRDYNHEYLPNESQALYPALEILKRDIAFSANVHPSSGCRAASANRGAPFPAPPSASGSFPGPQWPVSRAANAHRATGQTLRHADRPKLNIYIH